MVGQWAVTPWLRRVGSIPTHSTNISVAQLAEQRSPKPKVEGSIPSRGANFNALLSQLVEEAVLEAVQSQFESERGHHQRDVSSVGRAVDF